MGFIASVMNGAGSFMEAAAMQQMGANEQRQRQANSELLRTRSESNLRNAQGEMRTQRRQAESALSRQRAGWGASGAASSGTGLVNEVALATKLEQEISDRAHKAISESRLLDYEAEMESWRGRRARSESQSKSYSGLLQGTGNFVVAGAELGDSSLLGDASARKKGYE